MINLTHVNGISEALAKDGRSHVQAERLVDLNIPIAQLVPYLHNLNAGGKGVRAFARLIGRLYYWLQLRVHSLEWSVFMLKTAAGANKRGSSIHLHFSASYFRLGLFLFCSSTKLI